MAAGNKAFNGSAATGQKAASDAGTKQSPNNSDRRGKARDAAKKAAKDAAKQQVLKAASAWSLRPIMGLPGAMGKAAIQAYLKNILNHPEWYSKGADGSANDALQTLGMNFNVNFSSGLPNISAYSGTTPVGMSPTAVSVCETALTTAIESDETEMYSQAMLILWRSLAAKSGRNPDYPLAVIEGYVHNWRTVLAMLTTVLRAYELANTFSAQNSKLPEIYSKPFGIDILDIQANAAEIRTFLSFEMKKLFTTNVMTEMFIFDRTVWQFGSVFLDSDVPKPTMMIYNPSNLTMFNEDGTLVDLSDFIGHQATLNGRIDPASWADLKEALKTAMACLTGYYSSTTMRADILRVYGDNYQDKLYAGFMDRLTASDPCIYGLIDEYQLTQWQNTKPLVGWHRVNSSSTGALSGRTTWQPCAYNVTYTTSAYGSLIQSAYSYVTVQVDGVDALDYSVGDVALIDKIYNANRNLVNSYTGTLDQARQVSITRAIPGFKGYKASDSDTIAQVRVTTTGSELPILMTNWVITSYQGQFDCVPVPGGGNVYVRSFNGNSNNPDVGGMEYYVYAAAIQSAVDYAASLRLIRIGVDERGAVAYTLTPYSWDWNIWADIDDQDLGAYHGVASWSLYAAERGKKVDRYASKKEWTDSSSN